MHENFRVPMINKTLAVTSTGDAVKGLQRKGTGLFEMGKDSFVKDGSY